MWTLCRKLCVLRLGTGRYSTVFACGQSFENALKYVDLQSPAGVMELANEAGILKTAAARGLVEQDVVPAMHCHGVDYEVRLPGTDCCTHLPPSPGHVLTGTLRADQNCILILST